MQCFIPFSEDIVEQHPELLNAALVPFCEEFMGAKMKFEIYQTEDSAQSTVSELSFQLMMEVV